MSKGKTLNQIKQLADKIAKVSKPEKVILFGSWAWGTPGPDSDVDFCVIKKTSDTRKEAIEIDGLLFPRDFALDILVYTPEYIAKRIRLGDFFVKNILNKGQTLYASTQ